MKEFFEEYGGVIVTVLIILGIILVGYVLAGNGQNSALGKAVNHFVESMSNQANNVLTSTETSQAKTTGFILPFLVH